MTALLDEFRLFAALEAAEIQAQREQLLKKFFEPGGFADLETLIKLERLSTEYKDLERTEALMPLIENCLSEENSLLLFLLFMGMAEDK